ncbi:STAS domain-containing protein [Candidatus Peregrinibacteria bacterium]|nr:STAS domain-containing protein [Candidatus Peregrinibacteria bacterium]
MGPHLNIAIEPANSEKNYQIVKFAGEFDKAGHEEIRQKLEDCVQSATLKSLIFDVVELKFINSEGIGYLMELHAHLVKRGRELVLIGPNNHVADVFKTIGLTEVIKIFPNLDNFLKTER